MTVRFSFTFSQRFGSCQNRRSENVISPTVFECDDVICLVVATCYQHLLTSLIRTDDGDEVSEIEHAVESGAIDMDEDEGTPAATTVEEPHEEEVAEAEAADNGEVAITPMFSVTRGSGC